MKNLRRILATLVLSAPLLPVLAQTPTPFSAKPVQIVVGFPAGGAVDVMARIISSKLGAKLGTSVIVDNRPGFSGNIGAQYVAKQPADGTMLLMAPVTSYAVTETMLGKATGFSLEKDFTSVIAVGEVPIVLTVNPAVPVSTVAEYVAMAKAKPGATTFASSGNGSTEHVVGEMFLQRTGVSLLHVPYKGGNPAIIDLVGGQVQSMFATIPNVVQNVRANRLKPIAITTAKRNPLLPEVPTMIESGLAGFDVSSVYVIMAPAATPPAALQRLNTDIAAVLQDPDVIRQVGALGVTVTTSSVAEAKTRTRDVITRWREVVVAGNIKAE